MLCILSIDDDLEILTDEEVKHFVAINFSKCFKSIYKKKKFLEKLLNRFTSF